MQSDSCQCTQAVLRFAAAADCVRQSRCSSSVCLAVADDSSCTDTGQPSCSELSNMIVNMQNITCIIQVSFIVSNSNGERADKFRHTCCSKSFKQCLLAMLFVASTHGNTLLQFLKFACVSSSERYCGRLHAAKSAVSTICSQQCAH